jgi:prepilin-type N-terminal cleavage/methylation domain-containing protein
MRSTNGFTLIELLIVVVIIGILAAIAIPQYANTKEKAYVAAMKSDLRNLASAQESYFVDRLSYTTSLTNLDFNNSPSVTVVVPDGDVDSWRATATHIGVANVTCELYYGNTSGSTATEEGLVGCS